MGAVRVGVCRRAMGVVSRGSVVECDWRTVRVGVCRRAMGVVSLGVWWSAMGTVRLGG